MSQEMILMNNTIDKSNTIFWYYSYLYSERYMFNLGKSYEKDYKNCEYMRKVSDIPICSWHNRPCIRVEYELCVKYDDGSKNNTDNKVISNE